MCIGEIHVSVLSRLLSAELKTFKYCLRLLSVSCAWEIMKVVADYVEYKRY